MNSITNREATKKQKEAFDKQYGEHAEIIMDIQEAIYTEHDEHETCGYDIGCIVYSDPFIQKIKKIIDQALSTAKKEEREEIRKEAEDWIGECTCTPEYKDRGLVDHTCTYHELKGFLDYLK